MNFLLIGYIVLFVVAVFLTSKFHLSKEAKDERGIQILNKSYTRTFVLFFAGWIALIVTDAIHPITQQTFKTIGCLLVTAVYIFHSATIQFLKKKI